MTRGFDHLVLVSRDLAAQADFYTKLGFTLTPRAQHPWGTANHLAQMQGVFLELLGLPSSAGVAEHGEAAFSFGAFTRDYLAAREGMSMLVFQTDDAAADRKVWQARGLRTWDLFQFKRQAPQPDGSAVPVAFSLAFATLPQAPQAGFFVCQQHYPENFWRPRFQQHANGAQGVPTVWMVAREPQAYVDFFRRMIGEDSPRLVNGALHVACGRSELVMLDPASYAQRFPGLQWPDDGSEPRFAGYAVTADIERCRDRLGSAAISFRDDGSSLRLDPKTAFGCVVEIVAG